MIIRCKSIFGNPTNAENPTFRGCRVFDQKRVWVRCREQNDVGKPQKKRNTFAKKYVRMLCA